MKFEYEIKNIENKIEDLERHSKESNIDFSTEINNLKDERDIKLKFLYDNLTDVQILEVARHNERPHAIDYINNIFEDFIEIHGDRYYADDNSIITGFAKLNDIKCAIIANEKGRTTEEKVYRNFSMPYPDGYRKALRLAKIAEKFSLPIISFVDTPGAYPGVEAEQRGQALSIAKNIMEFSHIKTPILSLVIGEGCSGGALALAVADRILMMEYSIFSVISPEGCSSILFNNIEKTTEMANSLNISAKKLYKLGIIDDIISEPIGGAHRNFKSTMINTKNVLFKEISLLIKTDKTELINNRYKKYRYFDKNNFYEERI